MKKCIILIIVVILFLLAASEVFALDGLANTLSVYAGIWPGRLGSTVPGNTFLVGLTWGLCLPPFFGLLSELGFFLPTTFIPYGVFSLVFHPLRFSIDSFSTFDPFIAMGVGFRYAGVVSETTGIYTEYTTGVTLMFPITFGLTWWVGQKVGIQVRGRVPINFSSFNICLAGVIKIPSLRFKK